MTKTATAEAMQTSAPTLRILAVESIDPWTDNPRKTFDEASLKGLAESVGAKGVKVPIKVRPIGDRFQIVYGERRWRAAKMAGLSEVPALVHEGLSDDDAYEEAVLENAKRDDLNPLDEGAAYKRLLDAGQTAEEIAAKVGKSRETVYSRVALTRLIEPAKKLVLQGKLVTQIAVELERLPSEFLQKRALDQFQKCFGGIEELTFSEATRILDDAFRRSLKNAPWKEDDAQLLPKAGPCTTCPKRSKSTCYDTECFAEKLELSHDAKQVEAAEKALSKGLDVLEPDEAAEAIQDARSYGAKKFVDLDSENLRDEKGRKWRDLVGDKVVPVVAIDAEGKAHQMAPIEQVKEALKEKGLAKLAPMATGGQSDDEKKQRAALDRRKEVVRFAVPLLVEKAEKIGFTPALLRFVVRDHFAHSQPGQLLQRRELKSEKALDELIGKAKEAQLAGLLVEMVTQNGYGSTWSKDGYGDDFRAMADLLGLDIKRLEADFRDTEEKAEREAEAAKKKAAAEKDKPEPKKEPAKKSEPGVNPRTGKKRRMEAQEA